VLRGYRGASSMEGKIKGREIKKNIWIKKDIMDISSQIWVLVFTSFFQYIPFFSLPYLVLISRCF
jgi:hypothetical protein